MRVIAGEFGGRRLASARVKGLRPTADRVREALFSILGPDVEDARVLDLYAGTGALALEALSRGAGWAVCVERSAAALTALERNVRELGLEKRVAIERGDALAYARRLRGESDRFDVVFCDPPYADPLEPVLEKVVAEGWWTRAAVVEHAGSRRPAAPPGTEGDTRRYGDTGISIFRRVEGAD
ncbi:MAG TPA: 16S rRNA (guanine(966)-N(2))-methyltransferase RsmD [Gemmatimonadota bacterium]|nr:16S rRNA (guanine(966)-N(2))-methyltransferase RsmD [Gemmatimonadota bacterium]